MKNLIAFLGLTTLMALAACKDKVNDPEVVAPSPDNAALRLYYKYAEDPNLTVAFMGDFCLNGNKIDALMIQANEEEDWDQLKLEFGMAPKLDSIIQEDCDLDVQPEDQKVISIGVGIETDFLQELGLDTITDLSQVNDERFAKMTEAIAGKVRAIVSNFPMPDSTLPTDAVIAGDGPVEGLNDTGLTLDEYLNTLAQAIGSAMLNEVIAKNTGAENEENDRADDYLRVDSTIMDARNYGHNGYVSAADVANRTIWLFFYDDQEECNNILTHIKDDILVGSSSEVN